MKNTKNGGLRPNGIKEYRPSTPNTGARSGKMSWTGKNAKRTEKKR